MAMAIKGDLIVQLTLGCAAAALLGSIAANAAECSATSGARRVPLLELYTSEGCDSCPPAERWINGLPARGLAPDRIVALAFHVDYWNYLGWADPYARPEFSGRQRAAAQRKTARFVYTPQLLLNGKDYRRGSLRDDLPERIAAINREAPPATISLKLTYQADQPLTANGEAVVQQAARRPGTAAYLALYENRLATQVLRGENRGRRLEHDFVVRELAGPFPLDGQGAARYDHGFRLDRAWKRGDLHVAAIVQHEGSGEVLQALALGRCAPG
jgi:hypothetical protein